MILYHYMYKSLCKRNAICENTYCANLAPITHAQIRCFLARPTSSFKDTFESAACSREEKLFTFSDDILMRILPQDTQCLVDDYVILEKYTGVFFWDVGSETEFVVSIHYRCSFQHENPICYKLYLICTQTFSKTTSAQSIWKFVTLIIRGMFWLHMHVIYISMVIWTSTSLKIEWTANRFCNQIQARRCNVENENIHIFATCVNKVVLLFLFHILARHSSFCKCVVKILFLEVNLWVTENQIFAVKLRAPRTNSHAKIQYTY